MLVFAQRVASGLRSDLTPRGLPDRPVAREPSARGLADELVKRRLVAEWVEVGVLLREITEARPPLDGDPKVTDRVLVASDQRLAAGKVVERCGVSARLQPSRERDRSLPRIRRPRTRRGTQPRPPSRRPRTAARPAADRKHRCPRLLRKGGPVCLRPDEHERALGRVHALAVDLEPRTATEDDVELLALVLLVLGHEPVPLDGGRPRVRPERGNPEVVAHGPHVRVLAIRDVLQFIDGRNPIAHSSPTLFPMTGRSRDRPCVFEPRRRCAHDSERMTPVRTCLAEATLTSTV